MYELINYCWATSNEQYFSYFQEEKKLHKNEGMMGQPE
jgi:hypothetical protein